MAAYSVTRFTTVEDSAVAVAAAIETQLDTVTNTKVIYYADMLPLSNGKFIGVLVYDA